MPNLIPVKLSVRIHHCFVDTLADGSQVTEALVDEEDIGTLKAAGILLFSGDQEVKDCPVALLNKEGTAPKCVWAGYETKMSKESADVVIK